MDAYKIENLSTEIENVFQEELDIESQILPELESEPPLEPLVDQAESPQPQALAAEFANYTQQATVSALDNIGEFALEIKTETDSDRDIDSDLNELKPDQSLETAHIDEIQADFELEEIYPEQHNLQSDMPLDLEEPQVLEESVKSETSLDLEVAPDIAMASEIADSPELALCSDTEKSEAELTLELAELPETSIDLDSKNLDSKMHSSPVVSPEAAEISELADVTDLNIPSEIGATPEPSLNLELEAESALKSNVDISGQTDLEEPSKLESAPEIEQLSEEEITPILDKEADNIQTQAKAKIEPLEFEALQTQTKDQSILIAKLESEIIALKEQFQLETEHKIKTEDYQTLQTEVQQLVEQVKDWEQRYETLSERLDQQTQLANIRIDPEVHETLNQKLQEYIEQVQSLQSEKDELEQTVQMLQSQAEANVDRVEYEAVLEQLQHLKEKNSRSLWTRIIDWLKGN